jgi:hypothetical protein
MNAIENALAFCTALQQRKAPYQVLVVRPDAVTVALAVPGERWEVEFFTDGRVELERFVSQGVEERSTAVADALALFD